MPETVYKELINLFSSALICCCCLGWVP